MNVEEELLTFLGGIERPVGRPRLDPSVRPISSLDTQTRKRNRAIILDHFGFGSTFRPTLEQLAQKYEIGTRERVRQIVNAYYTDHLPAEPLPTLKAAAHILASRNFWLESAFLECLRSAGLLGPIDYALGLLEYMKSQNLAADYQIYLPDLRNVTRGRYFDYDERVIVRSDRITGLREELREAERIPGQNGLAEISFIRERMPNADLETLRTLIGCNQHAWSTHREEEFWYAFENRENVLINNAEKTFTLSKVCRLDALVKVLHNSLARRVSQFTYPDEELVRAWLAGSEHFRVTGERVSFRGEPSQHTEIEEAVVDVMRGRGSLPSSEVSSELEAKGIGRPSIQKNVFNSPLVFVDKSGGRGSYVFTLVSDLAEESFETADAFYEAIRERLRNIDETDGDARAVVRREQPILREWLFRGATHSSCALCGRSFGVHALVVAHKKKRAHCSEAERKDPNIVFPLCTFGCDWLYERGYLTVQAGMVAVGLPAAGETEKKAVGLIVGRRLDPKWTAGPASYFDNLRSAETERAMELARAAAGP